MQLQQSSQCRGAAAAAAAAVAAHLEQHMRATLGALASFNEDERMLLLRQCRREEAAAAQLGQAGPPELLTVQQFRRVWRGFGLKMSREQAAALFLRHGCDAQGLLPYEVFAAKLQGPYSASGGDPGFKGKISYRLCRKPVFPPSNWNGSLVANSARLPRWVYGYNASNTAPNAFYTSQQKIVYYVAALGVVYDPATHTQQFFQIDFPSEAGDASGSRFIVAMAFSPCGLRLVVVTGDNRHTVSVFAWRTKQLLHQGVGHNGQPPQVYGVVFNQFMPQGASMFVTHGVKHIKFWISATNELGQEGFTSSHGKFQAATKADVMSAAFLPSQWLVTGSPTGELLLWDARAAQPTFGCCCQVVQVHGPGVKMPSVHDGQPVLQGVRCLALRRNNTELVSGGSDGRICIHDISGDRLGSVLQTLQAQVDIGMPSRAVDFSPDGAHLAAVDDLKYSPDGCKLAAGSHDNFIDIFDVKRKYTRVARCSGHSSYVRHLDWSANSKVVQSSCGAYELLYFDAATGKQVQQNQRDTAWASYTNILGFSVMGIWPDNTDGTDINAVCRSHRQPAWEAADPLAAAGIGQLLATAGDDGRVRLLSYPCVVDDAPARVYPGHSSHVMNVRFSPHNKWVASVGGKDRAVFQWRLQLQPRQQEAQPAVPLPEVFVYRARQKRLLQDATAPAAAPALKEFVPLTPAPPPPPLQHVYEVLTVTSDIRAAGTDCGVYVILYGSGGHSGELKLENHPQNFSRGRADSFTLNLPLDLGQLQRLRIGHDSKGSLPRWHLAHIAVAKKDDSMAPPVTFPCGAWFAKDEADGATARVLLPGPLSGSGSSSAAADPKQPMRYKLEVKTSDVRGAGTDANVTVTVIGSAGSSGPHKLESSKNDFERGSCCCFELDAAVGEVQALRIGHDNTGLGPSWHLQEVLVSSAGMAPLQFVANRWLAVDELDGSTYVTLTASGGKAAPATKYMIQVYTSDLRGAGTDARVFIKLEGQSGKDSGPLRLENSKNNFERGAQDVFHVDLPELGELVAAEVGHDNSGAAPGWHLEQVVVVAEGSSRRWSFSCDRWLAKDEDDGLIKRRLLPSAASAAATYRVTTYTSDLRGAGTDAGVWIELLGELDGKATQSPRLPLDNSSNNFERGAVDSFLLKKQRQLGKLTAVHIGHDNKGMAAGWHLDHVEVVDDAAGSTYYFPCRAWLDKKEGDGATERLLKAPSQADVASAAKLPYKVVVCTSDIKFAGTDANVFIEICGDRDGKFASSGRVPLNSSANDFERGATDTFNLMLPNLGTIRKTLVGHDNYGAGSAWHLASVEVVCISSGQSCVFHHNGWLCRSDPPHKTEVELLPVAAAGGDGALGLCRYSIVVYTSDVRGAGTDANVSCVISGDKGSTPRLSLENAANNFERGARDEFSVQSADVGQPTTLQIAHDNRGAAPAWHLSHVEVSNHGTGARSVFYANAWLDAKLGTATLLLQAGSADAHSTAQNKWKLSVQTSDVRGAGTDADISAILIGEQGSSREVRLESSADNFERGKLDEFVLDLGTTDVGRRLLKLDIGFASKSSAAGALGSLLGQSWALGSVEAMHMRSGARQLFVHDGWVDKARRRVQLLPRDLGNKAAVDEKPLQYEVVVYTSDVRGAGTDADISIELHGDKGQTPAMRLETSANNFERGQRDTFAVAAPNVGALSGVAVVKEGGGLSGDWHLQMVEVLHPGEHCLLDCLQQRFQFPFNDWFKGGKVRQDIKAAAPGSSSQAAAGRVTFRVAVTTSNVRGAGTDANVGVVLYGEKGETGERKLESSANDFERGKTDTFFIISPDIGAVHSLRVSHDGSGLGPAWHLAAIEVTNTSSGEVLAFPYHGWLDEKHGTSQLLWPDRDGDGKGDAAARGSGTSASPEVEYTVTIYTSDVRNAGTSAGVFCELHGSRGSLGACRLENASDNFSRGRKDVFAVRSSDVGELQQLLLWHDGGGLSPDWHVQQVEVQHALLKKSWILPCGQWLTKVQPQQAAAAAAAAGMGNSGSAADARAASAAAAAKAVGVQPGCLVVLAPGGGAAAGAAGAPVQRLVSYKVEVQTSDVRGAGTDADVLLTMFGSAGDSGPLKLFTSANDFERGRLDTFFVQAPDVGSISSVQLQCQGGGLTAAWHLSNVTVTNSASGQAAQFSYNDWLDKSKGWVQLVEYVVTVHTGTALGAGTDGDVFLALTGENGSLGERQLASSSTHMNKFERGNKDEFRFQGGDVGRLQSAAVRLVERGVGAAWWLARLEVACPDNGSTAAFVHDGWLQQSKDNPAGRVTLTAQQQPQRQQQVQEQQGQQPVLQQGVASNPALPAPAGASAAAVQNLQEKQPGLMPSEQQQQQQQTLPLQQEALQLPVQQQRRLVEYVVSVHTGTALGAGTDGDVFLALTGECGAVEERQLAGSSTHGNMFERGNTDVFRFMGADVGRLRSAAVRLVERGVGAAWWLARLEVARPDNGSTAAFVHDGWLQQSKDNPAGRAQLGSISSEAQALELIRQHGSSELGFLQFFNLHRTQPMIAELVRSQQLAATAAQLLGVKRLRLYQDCVFLKEPGFAETNWHSDLRMAPLDCNAFVTAWIPLRPVSGADSDSGLLFAEQSHRDFALPFWHDLRGRDLNDRRYKLQDAGPMQVGDVSWHHGWMLHCAPPQPPGTPQRLALAVSYFADGARLLARRRDPSVLKHMLHDEDAESYGGWLAQLKDGAVARHEQLPLVYP
ncbi:hypothetical protein COO60DRAFT_1640423 [Scenedesmus sp. NREL 46B-D3]|nr:hypothetical protein COO60DRAFT_1640423 [Scenedesmus sp. NREL 46B-D3]